jgi:glucokinase
MEIKQVVVGIDIGGTNTVFGFVDREGHILIEDRIKTAHYDEPEVFVAALYEKIMISKPKLGYAVDIIGFGIGAPMGNINKGTIEYPADLPWKGIIPLRTSSKHTRAFLFLSLTMQTQQPLGK